jgi:D-serine deaminase-like pyridoxal phosphate-dependent protein
VLALARDVSARPELRLAGLMGWEGGRLASIVDPAEKRGAIEEALGRLTASAAACRTAGLPVEIVSCGGTGTYWISAFAPGVTEVQAGGGVFGDVHYREDYGVDHPQALTILTTVASRPTSTRIVCDAGWKSMSINPTLPIPLRLAGIRSLRVSAEHAAIQLAEPADTPRIGDRVEFVAGYCDSTLFLHDELYGVRDGRVEAVWPIAGRGNTR